MPHYVMYKDPEKDFLFNFGKNVRFVRQFFVFYFKFNFLSFKRNPKIRTSIKVLVSVVS